MFEETEKILNKEAKDIDFFNNSLYLSSALLEIKEAITDMEKFSKMEEFASIIPKHLLKMLNCENIEAKKLHLTSAKNCCLMLLCKLNTVVNMRDDYLRKKITINNTLYSIIDDLVLFNNLTTLQN
jgi:hypothetical protein